MEDVQKITVQKPIGIYVLTICIFIRFGVFQFITDFNAISNSEKETPLLIAMILIARNVFVAASAVWTFTGDNWGRVSLLAIVSLNVLWTIFTLIIFVAFSESEQNFRLFVDISLNPLFWLVICWWYLNKKNVVRYYERNESNEIF